MADVTPRPTHGKGSALHDANRRRFALSASYAVLLIVLVVSTVFSFQNARRIGDNQNRLTAAYDARLQLLKVERAFLNAEGLQRRFIILGDEATFAAFDTAVKEVRNEIATLKRVANDSPEQKENLASIETSLKVRIDRMYYIINARRQSGLDGVLREAPFNVGVRLTAEFKESLRQADSLENEILRDRLRGTSDSVGSTLVSFLMTTIIGVVLLTAFYILVTRLFGAESKERLLLEENERRLQTEVEARRQAQLAERRLLDELSRSNRELQDFAFVASHDLQEPLRKILQFGDRLRRKDAANLSPEGSDSLDRMQNAALRMQRLIADLLAFSRVTSKAQPFVRTDLNVVLNEVKEDLEARIEETKAQIVIDPLPAIDCDPSQLRQLFQNLLGNALKFIDPARPPRLHVANRVDGTNLAISVTDNGIGFDSKYADKIFTIFQRLNTRQDYEGSGIGLAICRKIVERHRGTISVQSEPGVGTTFTVLLPLRQRVDEDA